MLLYFGPEVLMPVVSAVTAAMGAILVGGKRILGWIRSAFRWVGGLVGIGDGGGPSEEDRDRESGSEENGPGPRGRSGGVR